MAPDIEDDDLVRFDAHGADPLPAAEMEGWLDHDGARIWHASYGDGPPVVLLHGGLGHAGNWGYQVPAIVSAGYRVIVIDSRGHGRSTRDDGPYSYERMASDVLAVMDALGIDSARSSGGATVRASRSCWPPARQPVPWACSSSRATWIRTARRSRNVVKSRSTATPDPPIWRQILDGRHAVRAALERGYMRVSAAT